MESALIGEAGERAWGASPWWEGSSELLLSITSPLGSPDLPP